MYRIALTILAALPLAACVTIPEPTAQELAYCQEMERDMGTHTHDHGAAKGMGMDPMKVTHRRCRQMLG